MKINLKAINSGCTFNSRDPKKLPRLISANGNAAKYQTDTGGPALTEAVEEEEEDDDTKDDAPNNVNGHVTKEDLEDGILADDEAEVTDIRDQGETREVGGTPVPVDQASEEKDDNKKSEEKETGNIAEDVTEEQNKVNEEMEISKSPAPADNKNEAVINGISDHSSNNEEVIEKDHKRLEGMF